MFPAGLASALFAAHLLFLTPEGTAISKHTPPLFTTRAACQEHITLLLGPAQPILALCETWHSPWGWNGGMD